MDNSKENQPVNIELSGEQAEVFDYQMDSDKEWFDSSHDWVFFRPEIEGEFNEYIMMGENPPDCLLQNLETGKLINTPLDWVCVIDIGRALSKKKKAPASGFRVRFRCPPPYNGVVRKALRNYAFNYAEWFVSVTGSAELLATAYVNDSSGKGFK
jgi:hypothetical protein